MDIRHICLFLAIAVLASCGNDDDNAPGAAYTNANGNDASVPYAERLEMPRLKGGADNIFLVHTVPGYGVNYAVEWDTGKRAQRWSAFMWCNENSVTNWNRSQWKSGPSFVWQGQKWPNNWEPFMEDPDLPSGTCATLAMHQNNGYDRGHIVASADRLMSMEANGQTYFLSNMHPQLPAFNEGGGLWYNMEGQLRSWNTKKVMGTAWRDTMWVAKGGLIDRMGADPNSGDCFMLPHKDNLVVPNYFFMAVLVKKHGDTTQGGYAAMGFFVKHTEGQGSDLSNYAYSIDQLEERTGIDFFCNLPDDIEEQVERNYVPAVWGLQKNKHDAIPY